MTLQWCGANNESKLLGERERERERCDPSNWESCFDVNTRSMKRDKTDRQTIKEKKREEKRRDEKW